MRERSNRSHFGHYMPTSLVTVPEAAAFLGLGRRTLQNHVGSGLRTAPSSWFDVAPEERHAWNRLEWQVVVAYRQYLGGVPASRPWGAKRDWEHTPIAFNAWYDERVTTGWQAFNSSNDEWHFGPFESIGVTIG